MKLLTVRYCSARRLRFCYRGYRRKQKLKLVRIVAFFGYNESNPDKKVVEVFARGAGVGPVIWM